MIRTSAPDFLAQSPYSAEFLGAAVAIRLFPMIITLTLERPAALIPEVASPLWFVRQPPRFLHIQGKEESLRLLEHLPDFGFAVVGTRRPQSRSIALAREVILSLKDTPFVIISGFARGIDAVAHQAALEAGLPTIAVLAGGFENLYPEENRPLASMILEAGGLLISEFPPSMAARPGTFLQRNRLIAGFSKATWVVEAGIRSGALNTARWAREQHRTVYATPCFPGDPALAGNQVLLDRYDALPLWDVRSLGSDWSALNALPAKASRLPLTPQGSDESMLLAFLQSESQACGGTRPEAARQWATQKGWSHHRFFLALEAAIQKNLLSEQRGIIVLSGKQEQETAEKTEYTAL